MQLKLKLTQLLALSLVAAEASAFLPSRPFAAQSKTKTVIQIHARSENSKNTSDRSRRGGPQEYGSGGSDHDYSGGNLKYGTGKFTQREGGVNLSKHGRSMQDSVYREDRDNVDRARGQPRGGYGNLNRMDEIEDLERGMGRGRGRGGREGPREGMRDRMMRNRGGGGPGAMMRGDDLYDMDDFQGGGGGGIRDRMGGGGLLRDMQGGGMGGRHNERHGFDDFGSAPTIMGGSSKGRGGGYRSSQFENGISNERRRNEEFGGRMEDYLDERDGMMDFESIGTRRLNGESNFDRTMGRNGGGGGGSRNMDRYEGGYEGGFDDMEDYGRGDRRGGERGRGGRGGRHEDFGGDYGRDGYGEDYGRGGGRGGGGGLLRDMQRP